MSSGPKLSVAFISLGCAKNTVDSQMMAGRLIKSGMSLASAPEDADVVIINTCSFIQSAREESMNTIRETCRLKQNSGRQLKIVVTGCLPQKDYRAVEALLPEVDAFAGVDQIDQIDTIVKNCAAGSDRKTTISAVSSKLFEPALPGMAFSAGAYAYLKIAEGCNHQCSFCTIPSIRGRHRSRDPELIVKEAEKLLQTGFKEITLVSQDTTSYGRDLTNRQSLAGLLEKIDAIGGDFWIRFLYGFPGLITPGLLDTMASSSRICRYLDVPVQHSHPDILKMMRRGGTASHVANLPALARKHLPGVSLRTSIITGFPGETRAHFEHLMDYLQEARFDHVGIFPYSPEKGTPSAEMRNTVPRNTVLHRIETLTDLQSRIFDEKAMAAKGTSAKALLERRLRDSKWIGRTQAQAPEVDSVTEISVKSDRVQAGDFVDITFKSSSGYTLKASAN